MGLSFIGALALLLPPVQVPGSGQATEPEEPAPVEAERAAPRPAWNTAEVERRTAALMAAEPDFVTRDLLARGPDGLELSVLRAGPPRGDQVAPPALLLLPGEGPRDGARCLELLEGWVRARATDEGAAELSARVALYVVPQLVLEERPSEARRWSRTRFAADVRSNFPSFWQPPGILPSAGPYPLSTVEAQGLAQFLEARLELAAVLQIGRSTDVSLSLLLASEAIDVADRRVLTTIERSAPGVRFDGGVPGRPGGPLEFAYDRFGVFPFQLWAGEDALVRGASIPAGWGEVVLELAAALPVLSLELAGTEDRGGNLWSVDVVIRNGGRLPTTGRRGLERWVTRGAWLDASGARVAGVGRVALDGELEGLQVVPLHRGGSRLSLGALGAESALGLRLLLVVPDAADGGSKAGVSDPVTIELRAGAMRAGDAQLEITLGASGVER